MVTDKLSFKCPSCSKKICVSTSHVGKKVKCVCGQKIVIPDVPKLQEPVALPTKQEVSAQVDRVEAFALQPLEPRESMLVESTPITAIATRIVERMPTVCTSCGSEDWKTLRLIYESGVSVTSASIFGIGSGGVGGGVIQGNTVTALASRAAPPSAPTIHNLLLFGGMIALILGPMYDVLFILLGIVLIVLWFIINNKLSKSHKTAMHYWNETKACCRCGNFFY